MTPPAHTPWSTTGHLKRIDREHHQIDRDDFDDEHVENQAQCFPHTIPTRKHRTNNAANSNCWTTVRTVQIIACPSPFHEQAGEEGQEQDRHHDVGQVHWPSSRPVPYFRISSATRSKKILPVSSNLRISTDARACFPSDCLQTSMRL